jgi:hypothetical protein
MNADGLLKAGGQLLRSMRITRFAASATAGTSLVQVSSSCRSSSVPLAITAIEPCEFRYSPHGFGPAKRGSLKYLNTTARWKRAPAAANVYSNVAPVDHTCFGEDLRVRMACHRRFTSGRPLC